MLFGAITIVFAFLIFLTAPQRAKEDIRGESISQPIKSTTEEVESSTIEQKTEPEVKRSTNGICHAKGTKYYDLITNFKSFSSLETCLRGDNRLPKK